jgi:predicted anti-sigma-YlaC factor YlaD
VSADEIVCREFAELATDYLEAAMPDETLELVEEHLAMCDWCRDYLHQIETTAQAVAAEAEAAGTPPAEETLHALVGAFRARRRGGPER